MSLLEYASEPKFIVILLGVLLLQLSIAAYADAPPYPTNPPTARKVIAPRPMLDDDVEFKPIFDGRTLAGWDGDPEFWRVEGGAIRGETTEQHLVPQSTGGMLIWRGGRPADFELKLE